MIIGLFLTAFLNLIPAVGRAAEDCSKGADPAAGTTDWPAALAHRNFVLHSFDGQILSEKDPEGAPRMWPNVSFGQWPTVTGRICNHLRGQVEITPEGQMKMMAAATRMFCLEDDLNRWEAVFHKITAEGAEFSLSPNGQLLTFTGDGHTMVFRLRDYVN